MVSNETKLSSSLLSVGNENISWQSQTNAEKFGKIQTLEPLNGTELFTLFHLLEHLPTWVITPGIQLTPKTCSENLDAQNIFILLQKFGKYV